MGKQNNAFGWLKIWETQDCIDLDFQCKVIDTTEKNDKKRNQKLKKCNDSTNSSI